MSTFVARTGCPPAATTKRSPRSPSPTHREVDTYKVCDLVGRDRLASVVTMIESQGIRCHKSIGKAIYVQVRHGGVYDLGYTCRDSGLMQLGIYDDGTSMKLATWGINKAQVHKTTTWQERVDEVCDSRWNIRQTGKGSHGGFKSRSIQVDEMTVKEMCDIIKQFM